MAEKTSSLIINKTGIQELDTLLNGGLPEGHVVLLSGNAGTGKTVLSMQWLFNGAKKFKENGLYITLTEPVNIAIKNTKTLGFFDQEILNSGQIIFTDLRASANLFELSGKELSVEDTNKIADTIFNLVMEKKAKRVVIDSITAIVYLLRDTDLVRYFIFRLGAMLSKLDCTTILTSEAAGESVSAYGVEEFISDGIIKLHRNISKNEVKRSIQIVKMRGMNFDCNIHQYNLSPEGMIIFPELLTNLDYESSKEKISTGNQVLDKLMFGGVYKGSTTLVTGTTGSGKSLLSTQFIVEGLKCGEPCLYVAFEESREQIIRAAELFNWKLKDFEEKKTLVFRCVYPRKKSMEEHLLDIKNLIEKNKIKRCVVDSLSAISNAFSEDDFLQMAIELNGYLKSKQVTTFFTSANGTLTGGDSITNNNISSITDNILILRYVEMQGDLRSVMNILKVRGSSHSKDLREYKITSNGIVIGTSLSGYEGVMTGVTRKISETIEEKLESEFKNFIGPIGVEAFEKISSEGLSEDSVYKYIDSLASDKIMHPSDVEEFKKRATLIFRGKKVKDSTIQSEFKSEEKKAQKKNNFLSHLFGGD